MPVNLAVIELEEITSDMVIETMEYNQKYKEDFKKRINELWEKPELRNKEIIKQFIEYEFDRSVRLAGESDYAKKRWEGFAEMSANLTRKKIFSVDFKDRGDHWATAQALIEAVVWWQAYLEIYAINDISSGIINGEEVKRLAPKIKKSDFKDGQNIRALVKKKQKAKKERAEIVKEK